MHFEGCTCEVCKKTYLIALFTVKILREAHCDKVVLNFEGMEWFVIFEGSSSLESSNLWLSNVYLMNINELFIDENE